MNNTKRELIPGHHSFPAPKADNPPVVGPIYQSAKFTFSSLADLEKALAGEIGGYWYQRRNNPTTRELEETLAAMQGRDDAVATASGISALMLPMISLLQAGDHAIFFLESYKNSRIIPKMLLSKFGIRSSFLSIHDHEGIRDTIKTEKTRMMLFESITHPMNRIPDIEALTNIAKEAGVITVLDNTCAGLHQLGDSPVDLIVHSLTKFANGHSDVMGGAVIGDAKPIKKIRDYHALLGATVDPHTAFLILRGLKTYFLRYTAQTAAASNIAAQLESSSAIARVWYPGLESHPEYALAARYLEHCGSLITFDIAPGKDLRRFIDGLSLFHLTFSMGSTESIIAPVQLFYSSDLSAEQQQNLGITERTVRISVGLEPVDSLLTDIYRSLEKA